MGFVQSVAKGYEMLWLIISALPSPVQAFLGLMLAAFSLSCMISVIMWFLGGG